LKSKLRLNVSPSLAVYDVSDACSANSVFSRKVSMSDSALRVFCTDFEHLYGSQFSESVTLAACRSFRFCVSSVALGAWPAFRLCVRTVALSACLIASTFTLFIRHVVCVSPCKQVFKTAASPVIAAVQNEKLRDCD